MPRNYTSCRGSVDPTSQGVYKYCVNTIRGKNYGHTPILQALATVPVPVTEPGTGSGTSKRPWYRYRFNSGPGTDAKFCIQYK